MAFDSRGSVWSVKGNDDNALADYNEAIRLDPTDATAYNNRGALRHAKRDDGQALTDYSKAIQLDPKNATAFSLRGNVYLIKNDYDKALADYTEAIRLNSKDAAVYLSRGEAWRLKRAYDKAMTDFDQATRLDPTFADAFRCLAWLWATCPQWQYRFGRKAIESATRACELSEWKNPLSLDALAAAYAETGDFEKALRYEEQRCSLHPTRASESPSRNDLSSTSTKRPTATRRISDLARDNPGAHDGKRRSRLAMTSRADRVSHHWRRYLRVSVRGLIVVVLVVAAGLGCIVHQARAATMPAGPGYAPRLRLTIRPRRRYL